MTDLVFMSAEHMEAMNAILAADDAVCSACAALDTPVTLAYELSDGPDGQPVRWSIAFAGAVRFGLEPTNADLVFRGDWARMLRAAKANRDGHSEDPGLVPVGDLSVMATIGPVLALARQVATLPVEFPETERTA